MQVSVLSMVFMAISAIVSIGLPIALFIVLRKKFNGKFLPMIIGAAAFIVFALVLESSVHYLVLNRFALREKPLAYILYGIFMAGIFEETARFISFKILLKRKYSGISTGLSYGIGHGGIEAVMLAGVSMIVSIVYGIMLNSGNIGAITGSLQGEGLEAVNTQLAALQTTAPYMFLVGGIERIFAIAIQVSLSVIMFYSVFCRGKTWLFPVAILLHAAIDIPAAAFQSGVLGNVMVVEGIVFIGAAASAALALYIHKRLREQLQNPHLESTTPPQAAGY